MGLTDTPVRIAVQESGAIEPGLRDDIVALFRASYRDADASYIDTSAERLRYVATAHADGTLVGFGFGETRIVPLPRMDEAQVVALAGISCVDAGVRQRGLFSEMAMKTLSQGGHIPSDRSFLFCGRMAHALSYRTIRRMTPHCVPAPGVAISSWQQEMIVVVARLFGVDVDPTTGIVAGSGVPVGFPRVAFTPTPEERVLFAGVDRTRGDSLLTMAWLPTSPPGWDDAEA
ncbi:MAG: hypothetical protein AAF928_04860 [Myxococcota bacterium]